MTQLHEKPCVTCILVAERHFNRRRGEGQVWSVLLDGVAIVTGERDPEGAACRALLALGFNGRVQFVHQATGTNGLSLEIARHAQLTTVEGDRGLRTKHYAGFPAAFRTHSAKTSTSSDAVLRPLDNDLRAVEKPRGR